MKTMVSLDGSESSQRAEGRVVETSVLSGPVVETLNDCAKEYSADLIVMGSEGRTGVIRLVLGSVAEGVLRNAPCSVQIVRRKIA